MERLLLLVDTSVKIVSAVRGEVTPIVFNSASDTYASLLGKIAEVSPEGTTYATVGLVQHGSEQAPQYSIVRTETRANLSEALDSVPTMDSWEGIIGFFKGLKESYGVRVVDLMSCLIYSNPAWVVAINRMETRTGLNFRASRDKTGNLANGGNWVMESDNVNIEGIYFTEAIREFKGSLLYRSPYVTARQMVSSSNKVPVPLVSINNPVNGMVRVMGTGSVETYGAFEYGGDGSSVSSFLQNNIKAIASTMQSFAITLIVYHNISVISHI